MHTKVIRGYECTDRAGVVEILGRSKQTVTNLAARRDTTGFPQPWDVEQSGRGVRTKPDGTRSGREWYRTDQITAFKADYLTKVTDAGQARSHGAAFDGDPAEMLGPADFARFLNVTDGAFSRYVANSKPTWHAYAVAMRHATLDGNHLIVRATASRGRFRIDDGVNEFDLGPDVHDVFARYGGVWQPARPGYRFPGDARRALTTLLNGQDFYLPPPDDQRRGKGGLRRTWRRATAHAFAAARRGSASQPRRRTQLPGSAP